MNYDSTPRPRLTVVVPDDVELAYFVEFAASLDDGEAVTCAIAAARGWAVATDDRKPISFVRRNLPNVAVVTTPELIKHWFEHSRPPLSALQDAIQRIRAYARYQPSSGHPLHSWWQSHGHG